MIRLSFSNLFLFFGSKVQKMITVLTWISWSWIILVICEKTGVPLRKLGLRPQTQEGLLGIFLAPFLHTDAMHLLSNMIPFLGLSVLMIIVYESIYFSSVTYIGILGNVFTWIFGSSQYIHIGASGIIFGMSGFMIVLGITQRKLFQVLCGSLVVYFYGKKMISGLIPQESSVSYSSHWGGLIAGILVAIYYSNKIKR